MDMVVGREDDAEVGGGGPPPLPEASWKSAITPG